MQRTGPRFPELVYNLSFLMYLFSSTLAHIENGTEISLWLMSFSIVIAASTTLLPLFGVRWLRLPLQGCRVGRWLALFLQVASWGAFALAMFLRLQRLIPGFQVWIMVTTLLWATWMLTFIYSRHACQPRKGDDTIKQPMKDRYPDEGD